MFSEQAIPGAAHGTARNTFTSDTALWDEAPEHVPHEGADDTLRQYLQTIGQTPLLTAEQEVALSVAMQARLAAQEQLAAAEGLSVAERLRLEQQTACGEEARRHLIQSNLRLVISVARRYTGSGMSLMDLIQEGNIGLIRAVEKFDHQRGNRFSTYATWWIRQAIRRAVENQSRTVRLPSHLNSLLSQIGQARARLHQALQREPSVAELAEALRLPPEKLKATIAAAQTPISLERPLNEESESCFGDLIEDDRAVPLCDQVTGSLLSEELHSRLERMPARERAIVELRYGLSDGRPRTLEEVGAVFGITRERARQLEERALIMLRPMTGGVASAISTRGERRQRQQRSSLAAV
jgi:RNA polymerase primary sigma factor